MLSLLVELLSSFVSSPVEFAAFEALVMASCVYCLLIYIAMAM